MWLRSKESGSRPAREEPERVGGLLPPLRQIENVDDGIDPISDKSDWSQQLDRIDPRRRQARLELENLANKVRAFKTAWIKAEETRIAIESQARRRYLHLVQNPPPAGGAAKARRRGKGKRSRTSISSSHLYDSSHRSAM